MECGNLPYFRQNTCDRKAQLYRQLSVHPSHFEKMDKQIYVRFALIAFALFPLAANIFAIVVLHRPQLKRDQPTFRRHLVLLTLSEILYCSTFINFWTWDVAFVYMAMAADFGRAPSYVVCLSLDLMEASFVTRNWMVVAISAARCEAVTRPLSSLKKKIFTSRRMRVFAACVFLLALALALMECFSKFWMIFCVEIRYARAPTLETNATSYRREINIFPSVLSRLRMQIKKSFFRGIPIAIVILTTVVMVLAIRCKRPALAQTQSNVKSATVTLVGFTVLFAVIEGVGFVYYMTRTLIASLGLSDAAWLALFALDKFLLLINSMTNVIAYVAFNKAFRSAAWDMVLGVTRSQSQRSATHLSDLGATHDGTLRRKATGQSDSCG